jgi:leader peptidase (prepilin peptidase)/N-methyltransferase
LNFPLIATGLLTAIVLPSERILDHAAAALLGYAAFAGIAWLYHRLRGQHGLGLGDAKLAAAAGAWLGVAALPSVLLLASVTGILWIAARTLVYGRSALSERIAFGLPLCLAIWLVWLYGPFDFGALAP